MDREPVAKQVVHFSAFTMDISVDQLRAERDRAVREFLALEGWACSKAKVRSSVQEIVDGTRLATSSLGWLLVQIRTLPAQSEPARRLNDLTHAAAAYREASASAEITSPMR
jgi:hypothetical protein